MAGVITDAYRMRPTKEHWEGLLAYLSEELIGKEVTEIHTPEFYRGNGIWRGIDGPQRTAIIDVIFQWLADRKHHVIFTAVDTNKFGEEHKGTDFSRDIESLWQFLAFHITLSLQKCMQGAKRGGTKRKKESKNNSLLKFDHQHREQKKFTELLLNPPEWSRTYYDKVKHQDNLAKIVDIPHFVDSKQVGMIQLADFISFFLRKYFEIENGFEEESYDGELDKLRGWYELIESRCICLSNTFPKRGRCETAEYFYNFIPESLK
ncbi:MAG: DUF3800 domain-containing protein [Balneolaceae bacterium]|nr:DUF3800 domain-containing protein [Balneolaceae bacterium]